MSRIRIKNFGPIKDGYTKNNGWLEISDLCVFIGTQGAGKSTVAKLISTMTWIEKALLRGDFGRSKMSTARFRRHVAYQNIGSYFNKNSEIEYEGEAFVISYKNEKVTSQRLKDGNYSFPKIMYVPSERNLVSAVSNVNDLEGLPQTLYTFSKEYDLALKATKGSVELPIGDTKLEYKRNLKTTIISGEGYAIDLAEASSGYQSFVPLYLVSDYLANLMNGSDDNSKRNISINREKQIKRDIQRILSNEKLSDDVKQASLEFLSSGINPTAFINIVEEPEQNLFPSSQSKIINALIAIKNRSITSKLIITTHSPYIISFLSIAIQAGNLIGKDIPGNALAKIRKIVPDHAELSGKDVAVFQLNEQNGTIEDLPDFEGIPSDKNYLNQFLNESNMRFDSLLEIEQEL